MYCHFPSLDQLLTQFQTTTQTYLNRTKLELPHQLLDIIRDKYNAFTNEFLEEFFVKDKPNLESFLRELCEDIVEEIPQLPIPMLRINLFSMTQNGLKVLKSNPQAFNAYAYNDNLYDLSIIGKYALRLTNNSKLPNELAPEQGEFEDSPELFEDRVISASKEIAFRFIGIDLSQLVNEDRLYMAGIMSYVLRSMIIANQQVDSELGETLNESNTSIIPN